MSFTAFFSSFCWLALGLFVLSCSETDFPTPTPEMTTDEDAASVKRVRYLALGDSYTIGESVAPADRWPKLLSDRLSGEADLEIVAPRILATTGWTTRNLLNAMATTQLEAPYGLVSVLIGVNNQFQGRSLEEYRTEYAELLQQAIALAGGNKAHVFVVSIPDYGYTPFGAGNQANISAGLAPFNAACKEITEAAGIAYYNITPISERGLAEPQLVAGDGLHPSGEQYAAWVDSFWEMVAAQIRD